MSKQNYFIVTSAIFAIVAIVHLLRVLYGWDVYISLTEIPLWASWAGLVLAGYLAFTGYSHRKQ